MKIPIAADEALVVVGALTWKPADRTLERHQVQPVQIFTADGIERVPLLDRGEVGMSCLVFRPGSSVVYGSDGSDLFKLDVSTGAITDIPVDDLRDVHEITEIDGSLWIANTGRDEVVVFDPETETVTRRMAVRSVRNPDAVAEDVAPPGAEETVDRFHANQICRGVDGHLYVLVHHVDGRQVVKLVAKRLIKMQGNGGVIQLDTGRRVALSLNGPHSIQVVGPDEQWICDSRAGVVRAYDGEWRERAQIPCAGWGRGVAVSEKEGVAYVGISAIRKRYLQVIPTSQHSQNLVQAFDIAERRLVGEQLVPDVEQVSNVYCVSRDVAEALVGLR